MMIYAVNKRTKEHRECTECDPIRKDENIIHANPDGWIEWHGGECPLPYGHPVRLRVKNANTITGDYTCTTTACADNFDNFVIAYRPILDADTKTEAPAWDEEAAHQLCKIYFDIAAEVIGEEQVRIRRDIKLRKAAEQREEDRAVEKMVANMEHAIESSGGGHIVAVSSQLETGARALYRAGYRKTGG